MSFGCNIADQHHCIQVGGQDIVQILDDLKIDYSNSVLVNLPRSDKQLSLDVLLGFQAYTNIIVIVEEGQTSLVDDLDFGRELQVVVMPGVDLKMEATVASNVSYNFYLQNSAQLDFSFMAEDGCQMGLVLNSKSNSIANVKGLYELDNRQAVYIKTFQNHLEPNAESNLLVKGVIAGEAKVEYFGNIFVAENAYGSNVSQKNKTLILSNKAKALSSPSMEVLNKDVQCAHGAAVSYICEEQLFYLNSRGLDSEHAVGMLKKSFLV
jgi:hypothetical protein